jgi:hypothetical protein
MNYKNYTYFDWLDILPVKKSYITNIQKISCIRNVYGI